MATIKLRNRTRGTLVFNLEHESFVGAPGENGTGKPESLTLLPSEIREVPEEVLLCREVANALRARAGGVPGPLTQVK